MFVSKITLSKGILIKKIIYIWLMYMINGAGEGTRTLTPIQHMPLKHTRLPVPPLLHFCVILFLIYYK